MVNVWFMVVDMAIKNGISFSPAGCCKHGEHDRSAAGSGQRSPAGRGDEHHFFCGLPGGSESTSRGLN